MYRSESSDRSVHEIVSGVSGDTQNMQLKDSPSLTESELRQLEAWNDATTQNFPQDVFVPQLVASQAVATPDAVAVVKDDQKLTYKELNERANQLAHYLQACGVQPDNPAAVHFRDVEIAFLIDAEAVDAPEAPGEIAPRSPGIQKMAVQIVLQHFGGAAVECP